MSHYVRLEIELRNLGLGPAVLVDVSATYKGRDPSPTTSTQSLTALGPGQRELAKIDVTFPEQPEVPAGVKAESFLPTCMYQTRTLEQDVRKIIVIGPDSRATRGIAP